jgi:hypothetical protein
VNKGVRKSRVEGKEEGEDRGGGGEGCDRQGKQRLCDVRS